MYQTSMIPRNTKYQLVHVVSRITFDKVKLMIGRDVVQDANKKRREDTKRMEWYRVQVQVQATN